MAAIGTLGDIIFSVSRKTVKTFDGLKWDSSVKYASHDRHLKKSLIEFTGLDTDSISFSMYFSVFLGVNPANEIIKLDQALNSGKVMRLIIGNKQYGTGKWVIEKLSKDMERYDDKGNLLTARVSISLREYAER